MYKLKNFYLILAILIFLSCGSAPQFNNNEEAESEERMQTAKITFYNYSREDVYLRLVNRENVERNIGSINRDENGNIRQKDSLIPAGGSGEYIIEADRYQIVLKRDQRGLLDADFNEYEPFDFPPSKEGYVIHLFPAHERKTTVRITSVNIKDGVSDSVNPSLDIYFSDDMIRATVEENIEVTGDSGSNIKLRMEWRNNRWLTVYPAEALNASARYRLRVGIGARNTEGDRLMESAEIQFATGNLISDIPQFNLESIKFDNSIPGFVRIDWELPYGADGSEIILPNRRDDLQRRTNYTFSVEDGNSVVFKILPYRVSPNGNKMYNQVDLESPNMSLPRLIASGVRIAHNIMYNTAGRLEVAFTFYLNNNALNVNNMVFLLKNNITDTSLTELNTRNNFTYRTINPGENINWNFPEQNVTYYLMQGNFIIYSFNIKSPSETEIKAEADRRTAQAEAERQARQAEANKRAAEAKQRETQAAWDDFWDYFLGDDFWFGYGERFGSVGINIGTSFATPLLIGNINFTIPILPYTFIEAGIDIGLLHGNTGYKVIYDVSYFSVFYYGRLNVFVPFDYDIGGWYFGIGGGFSDARYKFPEAEAKIQTGAMDFTTGLFFGEEHCFRIGYTLRTNFTTGVNHRITLGYAFRIGS